MGQLLDLIYVNRIDTAEQFAGTGDAHIEANSFYTMPLKYRIKKVTLIYDSESGPSSRLWASFSLDEEGAAGNVSDGMNTNTFLDNTQSNDTGSFYLYPGSKLQYYGLVNSFSGTTNMYTIHTNIFVDGTKQPLNFYEYYTTIDGSNPTTSQIFTFTLVMTIEVL